MLMINYEKIPENKIKIKVTQILLWKQTTQGVSCTDTEAKPGGI
jgi:hypothetical protein